MAHAQNYISFFCISAAYNAQGEFRRSLWVPLNDRATKMNVCRLVFGPLLLKLVAFAWDQLLI